MSLLIKIISLLGSKRTVRPESVVFKVETAAIIHSLGWEGAAVAIRRKFNLPPMTKTGASILHTLDLRKNRKLLENNTRFENVRNHKIRVMKSKQQSLATGLEHSDKFILSRLANIISIRQMSPK